MVFQYRFTTRPSKVSRKLYSIVPILQPCQKMLAKRIFVFFVNLQQSWPPRTSKDIVECDCGWNCKSVESQVSRKWLRLSTQRNFEPMAAFLANFFQLLYETSFVEIYFSFLKDILLLDVLVKDIFSDLNLVFSLLSWRGHSHPNFVSK